MPRLLRTTLPLLALWLLPQLTRAQNTWTRRADLPSLGRETAATFSIGGQGYLLGGWNSPTQIFNDLWSFDPTTNQWTARADLPVPGRHNAVAVTIGTSAYVGLGRNASNVYQPDWWRYDAGTDQWTRLTDFPGSPRAHAFAFALGGKAYVGAGYVGTQDLSDFWEYDPATGQWIQLADYPGAGHLHAGTFVAADSLGRSLGYVVGGYGAAARRPSAQTWAYEVANDQWLPKANLPAARFTLVTWALHGRGYAGGGLASQSGNPFADYWTYDPVADAWTPVAACAGGARGWSQGFVIADHGYQVSGTAPNASGPDAQLWEYAPPVTGLPAVRPLPLPSAWPNPTDGLLQLPAGRSRTITVYSAQGTVVRRVAVGPHPTTVDLRDLPAGTYLLRDGQQTHRVVRR